MNDDELRVKVGAADLLANYQLAADSGRVDEVLRLFLPDAVFRVQDREFSGREALAGFFGSTFAAFSSARLLPARHHLSSIHVTPGPGGTASTYSCFQLIGVNGLDHWGTYRDEVVLTPDGWRFARRRVKVEGQVPGSAAGELLGPP